MAESYCLHTKRINDFIDETFEGIRAPFTAGLELTAKCNLDCVHCYAKPGRGHADMSTDEFKAIVNILVELPIGFQTPSSHICHRNSAP